MNNDGMSPYQAPDQPPQELTQSKNTSSIPKVMGILHIVFGAISLLLVLKGLFVPASQSEQLKEQMRVQTGQELVISEDAMRAIESMDDLGLVAGYINLFGAVALLLAGIGLVKYLRWGRYLSNVYVLFSFVGKIFAGYLMLGPASLFMSELIVAQSDMEDQSPAGLRPVIVGGMIVILLIMSVYMVLSLILLNKRSVKDSLNR